MAWDCHPLDATPRPAEGGYGMRRNAYAAKLMAAKGAVSAHQKKELVHRCLTTVYQASAVALHEVYGFGPDRIDRFRDAMEAVILEYGDLLDSVDADYADEKLERRYKAIMGRNSP